MSKQNKSINPLLVAGGTLLFYMCAIPIVDALSTWVQTAIGAKVTKIQYVIAQDQEEVDEIVNRVNDSSMVQAIGFDAGNSYTSEDEDDG